MAFNFLHDPTALYRYLRSSLALVGHHDDDPTGSDGGQGGGVGRGSERAIGLEGQLVRQTQRARDVTSTKSDLVSKVTAAKTNSLSD